MDFWMFSPNYIGNSWIKLCVRGLKYHIGYFLSGHSTENPEKACMLAIKSNEGTINVILEDKFCSTTPQFLQLIPQNTIRNNDNTEEVLEDGQLRRNHISSRTNDEDKYDDKKAKTKIPVSRFRQTVEKVKLERRGSKESQIPIRRSSTPKLAINKTVPLKPVRKAIAVTQTTAPEDEFDKLYEEVVCSTPTPVNINVSLLNPKVDDPEIVENTFEEIIHDYDENKVEPIDVEKIKKSKIPFLKRKSQQEIEVQGDRSSKIIAARDKLRIGRNSIKSDEQNDENEDKTIKAIVNVNDKRDENHSTPKTEVRSQYTKTIITSSKGNEDDDSAKVISTTMVTEVETIESSDKIEHKKGQLIEKNIYKDYIKVGIPVFDSYIHEYTEKSESADTVEVKSVLSYTSNNGTFEDDKTEAELEITEINNENKPSIIEIVQNNEPKIVEIIDINENSFESLKPELSTEKQRELDDTKVVLKEKDDITKLQGKVGRLISRIGSHDAVDKEVYKIDFGKGLPKNKSVLSKIAMFERHEAEPAAKSKIPRNDIKLTKLITTDTQRTENVHIHTPLIVDEVFKPFQAITDNTNNDLVTKNGVERNTTQIVTAEMVLIESPETVLYDVENKVPIESNTLFIEQSKVAEEVLTPVLRKYEFENNENKNVLKDVFVETKSDLPVIVPKFIPVKEVLKKYESLNGHEIHASNKTIEDLPKIRPISEIINDLTPELSYSLDAMFAHQVRPISEILSDLNPQEFHKDEIENNVFVTEETDIKNELNVVDSTNEVFESEEIEAKNDAIYKVDTTQHDIKSFKSRDIEFKTLKSRDDNFKSLQFIQDYQKSKVDDLKRVKSVAELDLGDAVKGKVNRMIVRINSVDKIDVGIKEIPINIKELPRKRSVSEKIALFERKLTPAKEVQPPGISKQETPCKQSEEMPAVTEEIKNVEDSTEQPDKLTAQPELTADIQEKINQLSNAKLKYGKVEMPRMELANGMTMPVIAVGTALLDANLAYHIVTAAIDLGYRAIDTAYIYGNEKVVGQAIRAKITDGTVKREELFIISKLWSTYHRTDLVKAACEASLEALGLEYIDLFLIHNPMSFKEGGSAIPKIATVVQYSEYDYLDAWFGMEALGDKVKALGVSSFNSAQLQRVIDRARVKPVVNQVECHPYLTQQRLDNFCRERNITLNCFGVLGSKGTPLEFKSGQPPVIDDALVQVMASGLNVSPAQLLIRYQIECGHSVVVKSSSAAHLWDNLQALTFNLTSGQVDALHALNRNKRNFLFIGMGDTHKNYPFNAPF